MRYGRNGGLIVEKSDQCNKCSYFNPEVECALVQALHDGMAILAEPQIKVQNCPQYDPIFDLLKPI